MQLTPTQVYALPEGDAGTSFTIAKMSEEIDRGKSSAMVHAAAQQILNAAHVRAFDFSGQARAFYSWVLRNITFTPDPVGKEGVQSAEWTLTYRRGDCDCISVLMCSLMETVGMKCRLVTVASDASNPDLFSHVYPQVLVNGKWVSVDAARRSPAFGRSPARYFRKRGWSVHSDYSADLSGGGLRGLGVLPMPASIAPMRARAGYPLYYTPPAPRFARSSARIRRRGLRGLGDDWATIGQAIQAGTTGAANIIAATRATPYNLVPFVGPAPIGVPPPPVVDMRYQQPASTFLGMSTGTLALLGLGLVAVIALRER